MSETVRSPLDPCLRINASKLPPRTDVGDIQSWAFKADPQRFRGSVWDGQFLKLQFDGGAKDFNALLTERGVVTEWQKPTFVKNFSQDTYPIRPSHDVFVLRQKGLTEAIVTKFFPNRDEIVAYAKCLRGFLVIFQSETEAKHGLETLRRTSNLFAHFWPVVHGSGEVKEEGQEDTENSTLFIPKPLRQLHLQVAVLRTLPGLDSISLLPKQMQWDEFHVLAHFETSLDASRAHEWLATKTFAQFSERPYVPRSSFMDRSVPTSCISLQVKFKLNADREEQLGKLLELYEGVIETGVEEDSDDAHIYRAEFETAWQAEGASKDMRVLEFARLRFEEPSVPRSDVPWLVTPIELPQKTKQSVANQPPETTSKKASTPAPAVSTTTEPTTRPVKHGSVMCLRNVDAAQNSGDISDACAAFAGILSAVSAPAAEGSGMDIYLLFASNLHVLNALDAMATFTNVILSQATMKYVHTNVNQVQHLPGAHTRPEALFEVPTTVADILESKAANKMRRDVRVGLDKLEKIVGGYRNGWERQREDVADGEKGVQRMVGDVVDLLFEWREMKVGMGFRSSVPEWDGLERVYVHDDSVQPEILLAAAAK
ncbi:hypothetical protein HDV00_008692 [Rhizophlyctis rosea]|nr:hypothetical protein HDV00_008692 [Rhizophlyctis rosea]